MLTVSVVYGLVLTNDDETSVEVTAGDVSVPSAVGGRVSVDVGNGAITIELPGDITGNCSVGG